VFARPLPCPTITVRPFHGLWEAYELPGVQPLYATRERAIACAREQLRGRPGVIQIYNGKDLVEQTIHLRGSARRKASRN